MSASRRMLFAFVLVLSSFAARADIQRAAAPTGTVVEDPDGDGWTAADGDCCESALQSCGEPALVNPGAFDFAGNGVDDDCNGDVDPPRAVCDTALPSNSSDAMMYAQAIDLCQATVEAPPLSERRWGVISAEFQKPDLSGPPAASARSIRPVFGSNSPQFGASFTVLSTGVAAAKGQSNPNYAAFQPGFLHSLQSAFPADWFAANGNTVPTLPGCPALSGSAAHDPIMLQVRIRVPTNVHSFRFRTRFFGADYPEYLCSPFNDVYLVLLDSTFTGGYPNPADKNIARYSEPAFAATEYPLGVNLGHNNATLALQACKNGATGCATNAGAVPGATSTCTGTADLSETGFDVVNPAAAFFGDPGYCGTNNLLGAGTAWLSTGGNVVPGEMIVLRFILWDTSDGYYDSVALLDDFQWSTEYTTPGSFLTNGVPDPEPPEAPTDVIATAQNATTVNVSWTPSPHTASYHVFRRAPSTGYVQIGTQSGVTFTDSVSANTSYLYRVRAVNEIGASPDSDSDLTTTVAFSDNPLAAGTTPIRAAHLAELRTAANAVRELAALDPEAFTDPAAPGVLVKAIHVSQIRAALDEALTTLGLPAGGYTDAALTGVRVKAAHFQEIRTLVR